MQQPPLVAVSLKMYLGAARTREWVISVAHQAISRGIPCADLPVELLVLPTFPLLESTASLLAGSGVNWGAQDIAASDDGAQTGEVGGAVLAELGCRYIEVGHAERRTLFGEDDQVVCAKASRAVHHGLIPLLCVGEPDPGPAAEAAAHCLGQLHPVLDSCGGSEIVVAYEPVWSIGAPAPAPADHVREVCSALAARLTAYPGPARLLYGGAAGPGTYTALHRTVDGLFLGRFAHDVTALDAVVAEVLSTEKS